MRQNDSYLPHTYEQHIGGTHLIIKSIPIQNINPAPYNPRVDLQPGDEEYEKLKRSIEEFGYIEPLVWNEQTGNLVGGHQRFKILLSAGTEMVQVSVVNMDTLKEKALNIALNKIGGHWDDEKLTELLQELSGSEIGTDLTGFNAEELNNLFESLPDEDFDNIVEDDFDVETAVENIKKPETNYGDVWKLGRHILVCGDATLKEDVDKLMGQDQADLVVTDPPYNVAVKSTSERLKADGRDSILNDNMDEALFDEFLQKVFKNYHDVMSDKAAIYVFHPSSFQRAFENEMNRASIEVRTQCIWVKNAASFGWSQYRFKHEPVFYAFKKGHTPNWYGDRKQTTVWKTALESLLEEPESVWEVSRGDVSKYVHPTQKPLALIAIPLQNSSKKGDIVLDFFGGSGSTLMTCEQTERTCKTLELDPVFCDVIKQRYFEATGIKPELISQ